MPLALIDKQDSFEIVRDQIAGVLLAELANQQALAPGAGEDPLDYTLSVYVGTDLNVATSPIVSIWIENSVRDDRSTTVDGLRQVFNVTYVLDIFARGVSSNVGAGGYLSADKDSRLRCQAATRLVRNILSAGPYRRLLVPEIVWAHPSFENLEFGPAPLEEHEDDISVYNCRARFRVTMTEFSPELPANETLDLIRIDVSDHGGVILSTEIP
jgi:hypothetical protein